MRLKLTIRFLLAMVASRFLRDPAKVSADRIREQRRQLLRGAIERLKAEWGTGISFEELLQRIKFAVRRLSGEKKTKAAEDLIWQMPQVQHMVRRMHLERRAAADAAAAAAAAAEAEAVAEAEAARAAVEAELAARPQQCIGVRGKPVACPNGITPWRVNLRCSVCETGGMMFRSMAHCPDGTGDQACPAGCKTLVRTVYFCATCDRSGRE